MADSTLWWLATGTLVIAELLTGTFYLLMLSIGMAAGALAAHAGLSMAVQLVAAAVVASGAVLAWHLLRQRLSPTSQASANPDVNLDIGEVVQVDAWLPDGSTRVKYRGAQWAAVPRAGAPAGPGAYRIVEVHGSQLIIEKTEN